MKIFAIEDIEYKLLSIGDSTAVNAPCSNLEKESVNWNCANTYQVYDEVEYQGWIYISVKNNNTCCVPTGVNTTCWVKDKKINRNRWRDGICSSQTCSTETIHMTFDTKDDTYMFLCGLSGVELRVNGDTFNDTVSLGNKTVELDCWSWSHPTGKPTQTFPKTYSKVIKGNDKIAIEIEPDFGGKACVGVVGIGVPLVIGCTLDGVQREILGASRAFRNSEGNYNIEDRRGYVRLTATAKIQKESDFDIIQRKLERYIDTPVLLIADDDNGKTDDEDLTSTSYSYQLYGIYRRVQSSISDTMKVEIVVDSLGSVL